MSNSQLISDVSRSHHSELEQQKRQLCKIVQEFKSKMRPENFMKMCGEAEKSLQTCRLNRLKFRSYMSSKLGTQLAEKLSLVFDWSQPMEWTRFSQELANLIENFDMLTEVCFDMFDTNNDSKISEMDVMKVVQTFDRGPARERFGEVLYADIVQIQRRLLKQYELHDAETLEKNEGNELFM